MKTRVFTSDWFAGVSITIIVLALSSTNFIAGIERSAYDIGVRSSSRTASDKIAIIAIDDKSIEQLGRFPWSRDIHARMYDILAANGSKAIGQTTFFPEPQQDSGLKNIQKIKQLINDSDISFIPQHVQALSEAIDASRLMVKEKHDKNGRRAVEHISKTFEYSALRQKIPDQLDSIREQLDTLEIGFDSDQRLAQSIAQAGNVIFNIPAVHGKQYGRPDAPLPAYITRHKVPDINIVEGSSADRAEITPITVSDMKLPIALLGEKAAALGATIPVTDADGAVRTDALFVDYFGDYYPSMALLLAASELNLGTEDISIAIGSGVQLGRLKIHTDDRSLMRTFFYHSENGTPAFPVDSFVDILDGHISADKYRDKIVLIGATALGLGENFVTPVDAAMPPVTALAHSISSILNEDFFITPDWAIYAQIVILIAIACYIIFVLPRLGAVSGLLATSLIFIAIFICHITLMTTQGIWLQMMFAEILLVSGHIILTTKHFFLSEKGKAQLDIESSESNRMLGLSLQGQGQLDMAFEKFRKLPMDKTVLELLYNLALDYERKRKFAQAKSVYDHISDFDDTFRDVRKRSNRAQSLDENIILGNNATATSNLLVFEDSVGRPMLGRYELESELGKGAMGAVYLGKDPKIARTVAIKTLALSQEFEDDELNKVKLRFFREAETAGRLTHPNIVTIYDADEEHDLAYIAMEYINGHDLRKHIKPGNLLPIRQVLSIIRRAADGIDYAHQNNVVHRDIKPANIMWDMETDTLKITDFGIARITDASKTKTGMILGTPSYMSPEQLAGRKVTGQSDIFSLGVMLFQMVTGKLPFSGDSMAALMFKIANDPHPAPESINPKVPRCVSIIIDRAMQKETEKRYKRGRDMVADIDKCLLLMEDKGNRR